MITSRQPETWQELQDGVAVILRECGFVVEVEKTIQTARGNVEIDVFANEIVNGRTYTVLCECKMWKNRVPQTVIHGFRSVLADSGANIGYIISAIGFQSGALTAAELTNIRLLTWPQFQDEFEATWMNAFMLPSMAQRLELFFEYTDPLLTSSIRRRLRDENRAQFFALKNKHDVFGGALLTLFTPYLYAVNPDRPYPQLPLGEHASFATAAESIPAAVLDATGYREFLDAVSSYAGQATREFNAVLDA